MKFERRYSVAGQPVRDQVKWKTFDSVIDGPNGVVHSQKDVEAPASWSQTAVNILSQKYFRRAGVPDETTVSEWDHLGMPAWLRSSRPTHNNVRFGGETSAHQVFHRLAGCWTHWAWRSGLTSEEEQARIFYDELYMMLALQVAAPNSPQWFNTGLFWAYGIEGAPSGQWWVNDNGVAHEASNSYERPQPHACFIQPVGDSLVDPGGLMDLWVREARLFKHGSGTGTNFSNVRANGEPLAGGGVSSGLMSFLKIGDRAAGAIKSGGTTRRAAKMVMLELDHPEIEDFIWWKVREESKAAAMAVGSHAMLDAVKLQSSKIALAWNVPGAVIDRGREGIIPEVLDATWEGEAIETVSGQNSNNSVRVTDEFMRLVDEDGDWNLTERTTGKVIKTVKARKLWNDICLAAWACADPGVQFDTTINRWNTCPEDGRIRGANPCSEYMHLDNTACVTGDTKVWTSNGPKRFDELAAEGKTVQVLTELEDGKLAYRDMVCPRKTRMLAKLVEITFKARGARHRPNSFTKMRVTPDHVFYMKDGSQKRANELFPNDCVKSVYRAVNSHRMPLYNTSGDRTREHILSVEYTCGRRPDPRVEHAHHLDKNHDNNVIGNVVIKNKNLHIGDHARDWFATASPEQKKLRNVRISASNTGKVRSQETIEKLRTSHLGQKPSPEIIAKRSIALRGKKRTPQQIQNLRDAWKRRKQESTVSSPNHTIVSVKVLNELEDVYCGTVPDTGRFYVSLGNDHREGVLIKNCNLASLRLTAFLSSNGKIDLDSFEQTTRLWTVVLDVSVSMASYPSREIAETNWKYRNLGLGYADLGGLLMRLALPYDSDEGRDLAAALTALMAGVAWRTSAEIAAEVGSFPRWNANKESMTAVGTRHLDKVKDFISSRKTESIWSRAERAWFSALNCARLCGLRNAQMTLLAPTGTIGLVMDCDTTGIEPEFSLVRTKHLAGGGEMRMVNRAAEAALKRLGYDLSAAYDWIKTRGTVEGCFVEDKFLAIFDCAVPPKGSARCISPYAHVRMVAVVQPFLCGAVSKTINMPNNAMPTDVDRIYTLAHKLGVKAIAIYRDGSKLTQPLVAGGGEGVVSNVQTNIQPVDAMHRSPDEVKAMPHPDRKWSEWPKAEADEWQRAVDEWDKLETMKIYKDGVIRPPHDLAQSEIDAFTRKWDEAKANMKPVILTTLKRGVREHLPWRRTSGFRQKVKIDGQSLFFATSEYPNGQPAEMFLTLSHEGSTMRAMADLVAKMISVGMQYGVPVEEFVERLRDTKFEPAGMVEGHDRIKVVSSIADYIGREMALTYLGDQSAGQVKAPTVESEPLEVKLDSKFGKFVATGEVCRACGNAAMVRSGACMVCRSCGTNTGCG
jgi:ribonucleotide reductase alpha subunit